MGRTHLIVALTIILWLLFVPRQAAAWLFQGQPSEAQPAAPFATMQGVVRDENRQIVVGATVSLQAQGKREPDLSGVTDSDGVYRFSAIPPGAYVVRAGNVGRTKTALAAVVLEAKETKIMDLALGSDKISEPQGLPAGNPDFFDEPHFTVAGVTDTTNLGGHGSDTVVRNREDLAQETASLSKVITKSLPDESHAATEKSLRESATRNPDDFSANFRLGSFLVDDARSQEALPYLEKASRLNGSDLLNTYKLALAYANTGAYARGRTTLQALLTADNKVYVENAELHHLLADLDEKLGDSLESVRQYERAAELNPSEPNLFDWGSELLIHHAAEPAIEVFARGARLFPRSVRMQAGLGAAFYSAGSYDQAVIHLCEASDLNPSDPNPYLFLGKIEAVEAAQSQEIVNRLARFVRLQPQNAWANYYYAVSLQKDWKSPEAITLADVDQVKSLLQTAIRLDPTLGIAYLQLGILYSQQKDFSKATSAWQQALVVTPNLEQAHYRLAQVYREAGETSKAREQLQRYQQISNQKAEEVERQRHEVQQFVYELRDKPEAPPQ